LVANAGKHRPGRTFTFVDVLQEFFVRDVRHGAKERERSDARVDVDVAAVGLLG
jgi:hypothetical protein